MEGLLCHWALAIQEFTFETMYRKGTTNGTLMHCCVGAGQKLKHAMQPWPQSMLESQQKRSGKHSNRTTQSGSYSTPLWATLSTQKLETTTAEKICPALVQLDTVDGIVCRKYQPGPTSDTIVVPLLLETLHQTALVHLCMFVQTTDSMPICVPSFLYMYRVSKDWKIVSPSGTLNVHISCTLAQHTPLTYGHRHEHTHTGTHEIHVTDTQAHTHTRQTHALTHTHTHDVNTDTHRHIRTHTT